MSIKQPALFFLVLFLMIAVVLIAIGGGLFGQNSPWLLQWQHHAFADLCHQMADRSFWINGQPMAVCSRCFGIYTGFLTGWMALPFTAFLKLSERIPYKAFAVAAVVINIVDILGNLLGFWQNTAVLRVLLGGAVGVTAAALFSGSFFIKHNNNNGAYYGAVTTGTIN